MGWAETVLRPGGKPYRARMAPSAVAFDDPDYDPGVIILRTHDLDVATTMAAEEWNRSYNDGGALPPAHVGWARLVPWGPSGDAGTWTWETSSTAAPGTMPCVWFAATDCGMSVPGELHTVLQPWRAER